MQQAPSLMRQIERYASALAPTMGPLLDAIARTASAIADVRTPLIESALDDVE